MAIKVNGYEHYFGGKSGAGTYQTIINRIPPHAVFVSLFLGNCGVTRHIKPAMKNILNDLDTDLVSSWKNAIRDLDGSYEILNADAVELLISTIAEKYDTAGTFVYLDPPYRMESRKCQQPVYKHELTDWQHEFLLQNVLMLENARVMISHYPDPVYDRYLSGWHTHDFYSATRNGLALERLYFNYELTDELHDYSYIGEDFREREKYSRIKNNYLKKLARLDPVLRNAILAELSSHK